MRWTSLTGGMAAAGLVVTLVAPAGAVAPPAADPPPDTLTKASWVRPNGNTGTLDLRRPDDRAEVGGSPSDPIAVSLGDSYISGEAGRWAGNSAMSEWSEYTDAGKWDAYLDLSGAEAIPSCHRSKAAAIHFGTGVTSVNLACSGAITKTIANQVPYKPGIDFSDTMLNGGARALGQALMLKNLAQANPGRVKMVTLSIGGNDFQFSTVVQACVKTFLLGGDPCLRDPDLNDLFSDRNVATQRQAIAEAIGNVFDAMDRAGYNRRDWTLVVQNYPAPIASRSTIRYGQTYARQFEGGCGFYDKDLDWANDVALPLINKTIVGAVRDNVQAGNTNVVVLDLSRALLGHRLCEKNTSIVGPISWWPWSKVPIKSWQQEDAVDHSEWVNQIRTLTKMNWGKPYTLEESFHPNYWAQKAYQNCYRQVYSGGRIRGGMCVYDGPGLKDGMPRMDLKRAVSFGKDSDEPMRGASSGKVPGQVRKLVVQPRGSAAYVDWRPPKRKRNTQAYFYRTRTKHHRWSGWISTGDATSVELLRWPGGTTRVQVLAENHNGSSKAKTVKVRFRKR